MNRWTPQLGTPWLKTGDRITIAGVYARRTFWAWLMRKPRTLQIFRITDGAQAWKGEPDTWRVPCNC